MGHSEHVAEIMKALGHPRRVEIFDALAAAGRSGMTSEAIAEILGVTVTVAEHQIRPMVLAGIVESLPNEGRVEHRLRGGAARGAFSHVAACLAVAEQGAVPTARLKLQRPVPATQSSSIPDCFDFAPSATSEPATH